MVLFVMLFVVLVFGYLSNIVKFLTYDETALTKLCRFSGFFIPVVGVILGFIN